MNSNFYMHFVYFERYVCSNVLLLLALSIDKNYSDHLTHYYNVDPGSCYVPVQSP